MAEHVLRKIHHCTFPRKISRRPFLGFYPKNFYIFSLKNSDDLFFFFFFFFLFMPFFSPFSPFFFYSSLFFIIIALFNVVVTPLHPPSIHTHMLFYTFLCLLCALVTINTP